MAPKSFKLDCYSCKQLLKDSSLTLIWFCFVLFLIVFMKVPSEHSVNVIYCIRWLSNAFLVQCLQNFPWTLPPPPPPPSIASRLCCSRSGHWPSNCIGRYFQNLSANTGRLFSFSKCNPAYA